MKRILLFVSVLLMLTVMPASAQPGNQQTGNQQTGNQQPGNQQAGMRFGYSYGLYYQVTSPAGNSEVGALIMASFRKGGLQATGLRIAYEYALGSLSPDFKLVWGYGGHVGFMVTDNVSSMGRNYNFPEERFLPLVGADGYAGIEYTIPPIPVTLTLSFKPFVEMAMPAFFRFVPYDFGFSVAYLF